MCRDGVLFLKSRFSIYFIYLKKEFHNNNKEPLSVICSGRQWKMESSHSVALTSIFLVHTSPHFRDHQNSLQKADSCCVNTWHTWFFFLWRRTTTMSCDKKAGQSYQLLTFDLCYIAFMWHCYRKRLNLVFSNIWDNKDIKIHIL